MKRNWCISMLVMLSVAAQAKVVLPNFMGDNMVLQQQTDVAIWGIATPGKKVTIRPEWTKEKTVVTADAETGRWSVRIGTPAAGGPYNIVFNDGEKLTVSNVLIGEVWFCSGQSNMQVFMNTCYSSQPIEGATKVIATAKPSTPIRMCTIGQRSMTTPQDTVVTNGWQENTPQAVAGTSAVAYYFAKTLYESLGIPVGLLITNWGGSSIETWIDEEVIRQEFPEFNLDYLKNAEAPGDRLISAPCLLYNGQVHALVPYTFKGMLWYQGETNRGLPAQYERLQTAYVKRMRELFQVPDAPFYFVQIAPFPYENPNSWMNGYFNEAQANTLKTIPHSGMAVTVDVGEYGTIHPSKKEPVGERLALLALQNDYGYNEIEANSPTYKSLEIKGNKALVSFNVGWRGLSPMGKYVDGFEVAGADKVFHPGKAILFNSNTFEVTCDEVPEPVAVRYCFRNWSVGTVYNCSGIPLAPFRTDDWQL